MHLTLLATSYGWGLHLDDVGVPKGWYDMTRHVRLDRPTSSSYGAMLILGIPYSIHTLRKSFLF